MFTGHLTPCRHLTPPAPPPEGVLLAFASDQSTVIRTNSRFEGRCALLPTVYQPIPTHTNRYQPIQTDPRQTLYPGSSVDGPARGSGSCFFSKTGQLFHPLARRPEI